VILNKNQDDHKVLPVEARRMKLKKISPANIDSLIIEVRGQKVILDVFRRISCSG